MTDNEKKYSAFLSYSAQDNREQRAGAPVASHRCWGDWLHAALKTFSIPAEFIGQINGRGEVIPERIEPIFQDESERSEDATLSTESRQALEQSTCLVVISSPRSAQSLWVNEAVRYYKQLGRSKNILPVVIAGEPNASEGHRSPADECFVPALRHPVLPDGTLDTTRHAGKFIFVDARHGFEQREILANDQRQAEADLEMAKIQLIALLIGVGFNGLWLREQKRHFFDFAEAKHQAKEALQQVAATRHQLEEAQRQTREAQNQALEKQNLPREVHQQIEEAQNRALEAQNQVRETQRQLQEFQNKVRETQTQLEEVRSRALAAESKVLEAQQQTREAQNQLEEARQQAHVAQNKILEIQNLPPAAPDETPQIQAAQTRLLEVQNQAQNAQSQLEAVRLEAQESRDKFLTAESQVQEFQNQARAAQSQLEEARQQVLDAQSKILAAQNQTREAQSKAEEIQSQTRDAKSQIDAARNQVQESQTKIQTARRLTKVFAILAVLASLAAGLATRNLMRQRALASQAQDNLSKAMAEAAGKFELAPGGLDQDQIRQVLQKIGGAEQDENRLHSLDALAARISIAEISDTLKSSAIILDDQQRSHFQATLLDVWMKTNWPAAFDWSCQLTNTDSRQRAMEKIIPALASDNLTNTLTRLNELQPTPDEVIYKLLFQRWATIDPVQAIEQRQTIPDQDQGDAMLDAILTVWVKQQPDAVLSWAQSQPDSESKTNALTTCIGELAKKDFPRAMTLAESLPEGDWRSSVISNLTEQADWSAATNRVENVEAPLTLTNSLTNTNTPVETTLLPNTTNEPVQIKPPE